MVQVSIGQSTQKNGLTIKKFSILDALSILKKSKFCNKNYFDFKKIKRVSG